jgi:hypothetical protein
MGLVIGRVLTAMCRAARCNGVAPTRSPASTARLLLERAPGVGQHTI